MFGSLFGGGGVGASHESLRESYFNPMNLNLGGASVTSTPGFTPSRKQWKRGLRPTPGTMSASLSPEMQMLRGGFLNAAMSQLGQLGGGVPGYLGIPPELFNEFGLSNFLVDQLGQPNASIRDFYAPETPDNPMQDFLGASRGFLGELGAMGPYDFDQTYASRLANMRALDAPLEQRGRLGNIEDQYGGGILASTAGSYQTEGLERALAAKDLMRHDSAFGQALGLGDQLNQRRNALMQGALGFGQAAGDLGLGFMDRNLTGQQLGISRDAMSAELQMAIQQLMQGRAENRFGRAMSLFGAGQEAEHLGSQRAGGFLNNIGSMDQFLANLLQSSSNIGAQKSGAMSNAFSPFVQAKMAQDAMGADFFGQLFSAATGFLPVPGGGSAGGGGGRGI